MKAKRYSTFKSVIVHDRPVIANRELYRPEPIPPFSNKTSKKRDGKKVGVETPILPASVVFVAGPERAQFFASAEGTGDGRVDSRSHDSLHANIHTVSQESSKSREKKLEDTSTTIHGRDGGSRAAQEAASRNTTLTTHATDEQVHTIQQAEYSQYGGVNNPGSLSFPVSKPHLESMQASSRWPTAAATVELFSVDHVQSGSVAFTVPLQSTRPTREPHHETCSSRSVPLQSQVTVQNSSQTTQTIQTVESQQHIQVSSITATNTQTTSHTKPSTANQQTVSSASTSYHVHLEQMLPDPRAVSTNNSSQSSQSSQVDLIDF